MRGTRNPTFTASDVIRALDIPHGTLNTMAFKGLFKGLDAEKTTKGKARNFTLPDLYRLAIMRRLLDFGVTADRAREWAMMCVNYMDKAPVSEMNVLIYPNEQLVHLGDLMDEPAPPGAILKLTIYPRAITKDLKEKLGVS